MMYSNVDGIIGKSFRFGYGDDSVEIKVSKEIVNDEERLVMTLSSKLKADGLDLGNKPLTTSFIPKNPDDVVNMTAMGNAITDAVKTANKYVDDAIKELTGGTTGANVMLLPMRISIDDVAEGYSNAFGKLAANKFVDRIIFEVIDGFSKADGSLYDFSIGTVTDPTAFVPRFSMEKLSSTYIVNVCKTLDGETDFMLYIYKHADLPADPTFEQEVYCEHTGVSTSLTSDASLKIWNIVLTGEDLNREVNDTETFGTDVSGVFMDFGINIPVEANHRYRIVQRNPALAQYVGKDGYISEAGGIYTKDKNYTVGEDTNFIYKFLMTETTGDSDYVHIWVYDLDSETPTEAFRTYHIKNSLYFAGSSGANDILQYGFLSASEGSVGVIQNEPTQFTITLTGEVHSQNTAMAGPYPNLSGNLTDLGVYYPKQIPPEGIRLAIYNPVYSQIADDPSISVHDGVHYLDMTVMDEDNTDGVWIDVPISDDKSYPIVITVIDLATNESFMIGIDNNLTFLPEEIPTEPVEDPAMAVAYNLNTGAVTLAETGVDSGSMIVRILSF